MARASRKRYYRNYIYTPKAKWSPNIQEIPTTSINATANSTFFHSFTLAYNPPQTTTTVSQVFTVKNVEVNFYIDTTASQHASLEDITAYIMFLPQGMTITPDYNVNHPEYILAYKYLGSPTNESYSQQYQPIRVKSRLSRKLQSGDNIILFIKGSNTLVSGDITFDIHALIRWWTKAN